MVIISEGVRRSSISASVELITLLQILSSAAAAEKVVAPTTKCEVIGHTVDGRN